MAERAVEPTVERRTTTSDRHRDPGSARGGPHETDPDRGFRATRRFIRRSSTLNFLYRVAVGLVGGSVVVVGLALIPLPGPGWLIVFAGLAVLATEFDWAARMLRFARRKVAAWSHWVKRQSLVVRALIGLASLAVVAAVAWWYVQATGVPEWVPGIG